MKNRLKIVALQIAARARNVRFWKHFRCCQLLRLLLLHFYYIYTNKLECFSSLSPSVSLVRTPPHVESISRQSRSISLLLTSRFFTWAQVSEHPNDFVSARAVFAGQFVTKSWNAAKIRIYIFVGRPICARPTVWGQCLQLNRPFPPHIQMSRTRERLLTLAERTIPFRGHSGQVFCRPGSALASADVRAWNKAIF